MSSPLHLPAEKRAMSRVRIEPEGEWQAKAGFIQINCSCGDCGDDCACGG
jgi:hypothetical protein